MGLNAHIGNFYGIAQYVRDFIVLPHSGIKFQPLYLIPPQSPNTDTGRPVIALPTNASAKRVATSTIGLSLAGIKPSTSRFRWGHSTFCATEAG